MISRDFLYRYYCYLDDNEVDDLVFGDTDERNFRRTENDLKEEDDIDEALLARLRAQLERANQTIVNMRNKEKSLRTR